MAIATNVWRNSLRNSTTSKPRSAKNQKILSQNNRPHNDFSNKLDKRKKKLYHVKIYFSDMLLKLLTEKKKYLPFSPLSFKKVPFVAFFCVKWWERDYLKTRPEKFGS